MTKKLNGDYQNLYHSFDLGLVAYLLCLNFELLDLDKSNGSKVMFILKRVKGIDIAVKNYWDFNTAVDAQTYFNQLKRLKNQIFSSH